MASPATPTAVELERVEAAKVAAHSYAIAAEQLANKGPYLQKAYDEMRARGGNMASELVMGRDTLRSEAKALREEAVNVKDTAGVRSLSARMEHLDKSMQATTEQMGRIKPELLTEKQSQGWFGGSRTVEKTADEVLVSRLAPALERSRSQLASVQKDLAPEVPKAAVNPQLAQRYRNDHKMVDGAEKMALALSRSEKLTKDERGHYAVIAQKLHGAGENIHDKASARQARQEAMASAKHMMADAKRVGEKTPELQAGRKAYASAVAVHEKPRVQLAEATKKLEFAGKAVTEAKATVQGAVTKQDKVGRQVQEAIKAIEAKTAALEPLAQAQKRVETQLAVLELDKLRAQDGVKKAEEKLAAVQKENKDSFLGGVFGGAKREEEASKALVEAKARLEKAESKVSEVRGKVGSAKEQADGARQALEGAKQDKDRLSKSYLESGEAVQKAAAEAAKAEKGRDDAKAALQKAGGKVPEEKAKEPAAKDAPKEPVKAADLKREELPVRDAIKEVRTVDEKAVAKVAEMRSVSPQDQNTVRGVLATVEPNAKLSKEGVTPLMVAARLNDTTMVKELLAKGADPQAKTVEGKTALDIAGSKEVAALLRGPEKAVDATKSVSADCAGTAAVSGMAESASASKQGAQQVSSGSHLEAVRGAAGAEAISHSARDGKTTLTFKDGSTYAANGLIDLGGSHTHGGRRAEGATAVNGSAGLSRSSSEQFAEAKTAGHTWNADDKVKGDARSAGDSTGSKESSAVKQQEALQQEGRRQSTFSSETPSRVIVERERG